MSAGRKTETGERGSRIRRVLVSIAVVVGAWALVPARAMACKMCWGANGVDDPTVEGITVAMLLLVGMTGFVGCGIGAFFIRLRRREKLIKQTGSPETGQGDARRVEDIAS